MKQITKQLMVWTLGGFLLINASIVFSKTIGLTSPNDTVNVTVTLANQITYSVSFNGKRIIYQAGLGMTLDQQRVLALAPKLINSDTHRVDEILRPELRVKSEVIEDSYKELTLTFAGQYKVLFRAYDDAVAYRFETLFDKPIKVLKEKVAFNFARDAKVYFPEETSFQTHSERIYKELMLSEIAPTQFCGLPALVDLPGGPKVAITEVDLRDYAGLYLQGSLGTTLQGRLPKGAWNEKLKGDRNVLVTKRADFLAETQGRRSFPWRVLIFADEDADLLENQTVYKLAAPSLLKEHDWIRPGKVAWDWWNANNISGVDFRAGVNTETYKYYIDFAAQYGLEYIILDEGWYELGDLLAVVPEMDMEALFAYARKKKVGIILWVVWKTLNDQLTVAMDQFEQWGAKGIKVDFMQRDDQWMVNYYWRIAEEAAKRKMLVDFHGCYSPKGLRRTYPNVISREGVKGLENCKWSKDITPEHDCTIPFIRMLAGPMDFTPGAMVNRQEKNFNPVFDRPMSQGTRCHQLGMYVIYESPLQMLADTPTNYLREPECMEFLSAVPTVWDQTIVLDAKLGDYCVIARRSGKEWYVGAMTDGAERELRINLSFLDRGKYRAQIYEDGINADRCASDFKMIKRTVRADLNLKLKMAPGGGWVARIRK